MQLLTVYLPYLFFLPLLSAFKDHYEHVTIVFTCKFGITLQKKSVWNIFG